MSSMNEGTTGFLYCIEMACVIGAQEISTSTKNSETIS